MTRMNFAGTEEEVVTRDEFSLEKARQVLKDETVAVLGYGVQGPAQALNMRDNGIHVIVGSNPGRSWDKAVKDGWTPGETLFSLEEAAAAGYGDPIFDFRCRPENDVAKNQSLFETGRRAIFLTWFFHRLQRPDRSGCPRVSST